MYKKNALLIGAAMALALSILPSVSAQTKFSVQVNKKDDGTTAYPSQVTLLAEDSDGNILNITTSGGVTGPTYTVSAGGAFTNFTLQASPSGAKSVTLFFSKSVTFPAGTTAPGVNTITFAAATSGLAVGNIVTGPGIPADTTIIGINTAMTIITLSNTAGLMGSNSFTFFASSTSTNFPQASIPSLVLVSSRAQSSYIVLAP